MSASAAAPSRARENSDMARVEWTRTEPGDIEQVVSMLLCRENPSAIRIRPSRGDGGIDVLAPSARGSGVAVYQVKSFSSNLTAGQKAQVERSFRRLLDYAEGHGLRVAEWYLTLPLDPTTDNLEWLSGFTAGHGITAEWRGLGFLEGLAGTYPALIDYYLRDGKDRLQTALESITAVLRTTLQLGPAAGAPASSPAGPLTPAETTATLVALHATLNEHDPHFSYDFSVDSACPEVPDQPGLVAALQEGDGERWVTFKVFARCAESLIERPVPLSLKITAEPGSDLHRGIEAFERYGTPFTAPAGTADAELDLPGALGGSITGGSARLESAVGIRSAAYDIRLQIVDQAAEAIAETLVHMEPPTTGPSGRGVRAHGTEQHGVFTFEVLTDLEAQTASYTVHRNDLTGSPPGQLLPGLRLLREFRHPHGLRVARPFGPATHQPEPLPEGAGADPATGLVFDIVDALATIQEHTAAQLRVPDLAELNWHQVREFLRVAELMRGAAISVPWKEMAVGRWPGTSPPPDGLFSVLMYQELSIGIDGQQASLGYQQVHLPAARVDRDSATGHDDHQGIRIVAAGGARATIRYAQNLPAGRQPSRASRKHGDSQDVVDLPCTARPRHLQTSLKFRTVVNRVEEQHAPRRPAHARKQAPRNAYANLTTRDRLANARRSSAASRIFTGQATYGSGL